jgi:peptidoglycan/xylan/chitin deacetylase (PgdA/CDA1 family)
MYHRFDPDTRGLARQCEHIRRYYRPVSLAEVGDAYRRQQPLPTNALAVTVDDGYRDFLTAAHPVFAAHGIPATVFLVSDFIDRKLWLWVDVVEYLLAKTPHSSFVLALGEDSPRAFSLATSSEREAATAAVIQLLKDADNDARLAALTTMLGAVDVELPPVPPEEYAPMAWDEIRRLTRDGVEFGAHTKTHPILSRIADGRVLEEEILASRSRIEAETGRPVLHFCYPNGRLADFTAQSLEVLERGGFQTAVTTERGMNIPTTPPFLLRRLGVEPGNPQPYFEELLAGVRTA